MGRCLEGLFRLQQVTLPSPEGPRQGEHVCTSGARVQVGLLFAVTSNCRPIGRSKDGREESCVSRTQLLPR